MAFSTCTKCNYSLSINRDSNQSKEKKIFKINSVEKFIENYKKLKKEGFEEEYEINFNKDVNENNIATFLKNKYSNIEINNNLKNAKNTNTNTNAKNTKDGDKSVDIKKVLDLFKNLNKKKFKTEFVQKCSACDSTYELKQNTIIYSINLDKQISIFNDDNIELKINDPTLPRTKDYICPNKNCDTNNVDPNDKNYLDILIKKEAVFYRGNGRYNLKYACCVCKYSWFI